MHTHKRTHTDTDTDNRAHKHTCTQTLTHTQTYLYIYVFTCTLTHTGLHQQRCLAAIAEFGLDDGCQFRAQNQTHRRWRRARDLEFTQVRHNMRGKDLCI